MEFLEHTIGEGEISPQVQKVQAIIEYATQTNVMSAAYLQKASSYSDLSVTAA